MLRDDLHAFRQVFKQPCADVGDGFQLPRAAVALDELAGQRARLEPEHDLVRGLRDFREGAEREDDRSEEHTSELSHVALSRMPSSA